METLTYQEKAIVQKLTGKSEWGSNLYGKAQEWRNVHFYSSYEKVYPWLTTIDRMEVFKPNKLLLDKQDKAIGTYQGAKVIDNQYNVFTILEIEEKFTDNILSSLLFYLKLEGNE